MPLAQLQLIACLLGPNHPLHLHHAKKTRFAAALQLLKRIGYGLVAGNVTNSHPLLAAPLFDSEKSMCHNIRALNVA